jgi:hypothetical protein
VVFLHFTAKKGEYSKSITSRKPYFVPVEPISFLVELLLVIQPTYWERRNAIVSGTWPEQDSHLMEHFGMGTFLSPLDKGTFDCSQLHGQA